jgi:GNAT acetyltransferase-like protein
MSASSKGVHVARYTAGEKRRWDELVGTSKNGVFLFRRDYMDYHADRFADHSLLFTCGDELLAVLPANATDDALVSHGGLTFGGVVCDARMRTATMLRIFDAIGEHLRAEGKPRLIYKAVPHIYHRVPAEEDLYALYRNNARLIRRDLSSTIVPRERVGPTKGRKWSLKRSQAAGLEVRRSADFAAFMAIEADVLRVKYGLRPVHSAGEMALLAERFPDHIKLFAAFRGSAMLAGVCVYESANVAHAQYIAATDEGKRVGALDAILHRLITEDYAGKAYFDFGISTEQEGRHVNDGLLDNKESFGARAVVYDFYELRA